MNVVIWIAVTAALFMIFRGIMLWYWRVNEAVDLLREISNKLDRNMHGSNLPESLIDPVEGFRTFRQEASPGSREKK